MKCIISSNIDMKTRYMGVINHNDMKRLELHQVKTWFYRGKTMQKSSKSGRKQNLLNSKEKLMLEFAKNISCNSKDDKMNLNHGEK